MNAARDVASFHAPVEELGSSDISIMVREVYREVGVEYPEMNEVKDTIKYDPKTGKITGWEHESDWQPAQGKDPRGKVTHLSDVARRKSEELANAKLDEGRMKEVDMDLTELSDEEFKAKYGKTKEEMKAALAEGFDANGFYGEITHPEGEGEMLAYYAVVDADTNKVSVVRCEDDRYWDECEADAQAAWDSRDADTMDEGHEDHVNRDEKLKRIGAKPPGMLDKLKTIPQGIKAMAKGEPEDDVTLYNKQFDEDIEQMRRIAGLK